MSKDMKKRLLRLEKIANANREDLFLVFVYEDEYDIFNAVTMKSIGSMSEKPFNKWLSEIEKTEATVIIDDIPYDEHFNA